jgi:hypothetical protein
MLAAMASDALIEVIDMTEFVASQRPWAQDDSTTLVTPTEHVYPWPSGRQELNK